MSELMLGYVDHAGELQTVRYSIDAPIGSNTRAAQVGQLQRHLEALKGQGLKCGYWSLESWARGWGRHKLLNTGTHKSYNR